MIKQKKANVKVISILIFITLILSGVIGYLNLNKKETKYESNNTKLQNEEVVIQELGDKIEEINEDNNEKTSKKQKLEELRSRYATRGLVVSGDIHLANDDYILALRKYIEASKKNKNDEKLIEKIGDTYYLMKKWELANSYYKKIEKKEINKSLIADTYLYSLDLENESLTGVTQKIDTFGLSNQDTFYYQNSIKCIEDLNQCKFIFTDYISNLEEIESEKLQSISTALENYKNFQLDEPYYENALIAGALLENGQYPIAALVGKKILDEKTDYRPVIKIVAQSYFELGEIEKTKEYLNKFYKIDQSDASVTYMLGIINQKVHDYLLSNIYLTKALKLGYEDTESLHRMQIYNSYILEDSKGILKHFDSLIENQEIPEYNDLVLAIYYNLINSQVEKATGLTKIGIEQYPTNEDFYGFSGWILLEQGQEEKAKEVLLQGLEINSDNALINLNLGKVELILGEELKAKLYFKKAKNLDKGGEISKIAKTELELLEKKEENEESGTKSE